MVIARYLKDNTDNYRTYTEPVGEHRACAENMSKNTPINFLIPQFKKKKDLLKPCNIINWIGFDC